MIGEVAGRHGRGLGLINLFGLFDALRQGPRGARHQRRREHSKPGDDQHELRGLARQQAEREGLADHQKCKFAALAEQ